MTRPYRQGVQLRKTAASTPCQLEVKRLKMAHNCKLEFEIDETVLEYGAGFKKW